MKFSHILFVLILIACNCVDWNVIIVLYDWHFGQYATYDNLYDKYFAFAGASPVMYISITNLVDLSNEKNFFLIQEYDIVELVHHCG